MTFKAIFFLFLSIAAISCSSSTIPFLRLYLQNHEAHTTEAKTFYWGITGNTTFYLDEAEPRNTWVTVSVYESDDQKLSLDDENFLADYVEISRVDNFVALSFKAKQIALSVYPPIHCGMFLDIEDTIDMDIPVDSKTGAKDMKVMMNFVFGLQDQEELVKDYNFLEGVCNVKAQMAQE